MKEPILITEEELEYYTKPYKEPYDRLNEGNVGNEAYYLSEEEYERDLQNCMTFDEFVEAIDEEIRKRIPNP